MSPTSKKGGRFGASWRNTQGQSSRRREDWGIAQARKRTNQQHETLATLDPESGGVKNGGGPGLKGGKKEKGSGRCKSPGRRKSAKMHGQKNASVREDTKVDSGLTGVDLPKYRPVGKTRAWERKTTNTMTNNLRRVPPAQGKTRKYEEPGASQNLTKRGNDNLVKRCQEKLHVKTS